MVFPKIKAFAASHRQALTIGTIFMLSIVRLTPPAALAETLVPEANQSLETQTYLYGESAQANQVGKGYVVFQRQGHSVVGAFHYPQSEFSCFTGKMINKRLQVVTLALGEEAPSSVNVPLSQLHAVGTIGSSEKNSLKTCQRSASEFQPRSVVQVPAQ
ncbi:hypothetical protein C1752_03723 [Acaryochloris thomasi RCC1774]|uniref:Uncharacterized protein n=1 Tax=Acaryochloris thomasi RCC1774 TaxID=1764569 RepID=A0A2W1JVJ2_9CYAN|nr:hypothetical protein [Acaryochloris thomasi]PZD72487.1 hypothetical protein C1752_03723 [Acaryochloris thomasi RCC1774]